MVHKSQVKISAIVPTYNRSHYLEKAIISLQDQNFPKDSYEIIVVDNNSTDDTPEIIEKCQKNDKKELIYVKEPEIGLHNARHRGAKVAKGEILAFTDDDAFCHPDWLKEMQNTYNNDERIGVVGGKILPLWEGEPPEWMKELPIVYLGLMDEGNSTKEVSYVWGVNMSIKKDLLYRAGGFNPDIMSTRGGELSRETAIGDGESGLIDKVRDLGYRILYNPKMIVYHNIPKSRMTIDCIKSRYYNSGIVYSYRAYKKKKHSIPILASRVLFFLILVFLWFTLDIMSSLFHPKSKYLAKFKSAFYSSRAKYEFKLLIDPKFRQFVLRDKWI